MEVLIGMIWFGILVITPLSFLVTAYYNYVNEVPISDIVVRFLGALVGFILITIPVSFLVFFMIFAGAHTKPVGQALGINERIFYFVIIIGYGILCWLLCSLINGSLIRLWRVFRWESGEIKSIFDEG